MISARRSSIDPTHRPAVRLAPTHGRSYSGAVEASGQGQCRLDLTAAHDQKWSRRFTNDRKISIPFLSNTARFGLKLWFENHQQYVPAIRTASSHRRSAFGRQHAQIKPHAMPPPISTADQLAWRPHVFIEQCTCRYSTRAWSTGAFR
jgi:hypothetical protein